MSKPDPPRRKRRSPGELRTLILEAAAHEFESHGFAGATTANIAGRAQTTEAQIFRLFASKAELFRAAIFDALNAHFLEFNSKHPRVDASDARYRDVAELYIDELRDFMATHSRMLMSLIVTNSYIPGGQSGLDELDGLQSYFKRGAGIMTARTDEQARIPPEIMVRISFAALMGMVLFNDVLQPPSSTSDETLRRAILDFMLEGLAANAPPQHRQ